MLCEFRNMITQELFRVWSLLIKCKSLKYLRSQCKIRTYQVYNSQMMDKNHQNRLTRIYELVEYRSEANVEI